MLQSSSQYLLHQLAPAPTCSRCPHVEMTRRRRRGAGGGSSRSVVAASATTAQHALYLVADDTIPPGIQESLGASAGSKTSLLQALLERAQVEAQQRASGGAAPPTNIDTAADDAILSRIPGKDALTSGVAEIMRGTDSASSSLQGLLQGARGSSVAQSGSGGLDLQQLLDASDAQLKGAFEGLAATPTALQQSLDSLVQGGAAKQLSQLQSSLQGLAPEKALAGVQAAASGVQAELNGAVQTVGAAVLPGNSPSSSELLESRRAAGHLLDLTPVYKAWATLVQPFEIFGDRWLLNILFLGVFALLGFTLLTKAPRQ
mmetsp:Transcript_12127/g.31938  ORF Transcript_12127/g.31938 Transcript_12127/m.31938 type:complete len:317 (-) Transcript_12127:588-1538(-)